MGQFCADGDAVGLSINLRSDLAQLGDAELAARLEQAWQAYREIETRFPRIKLWYSQRGPIRHPWAYRFLSMLGISGSGFAYFGSAPFLLGPRHKNPHLTLCEIRDLTDEMQRRKDERQGTKG
jgi:hypothetical protein